MVEFPGPEEEVVTSVWNFGGFEWVKNGSGARVAVTMVGSYWG
jgi:hypothetical protein